MMKWFTGINSLKDLHKAYIKLAKQWHPDLHKDNKATAEQNMKEINAEYDFLTERLKSYSSWQNNDEGKQTYSDITDTEEFKKVIEKIIGLDGLQVELCGRWLWISGNTYKHKQILKEVGCKWASKKICGTGIQKTSRKKDTVK